MLNNHRRTKKLSRVAAFAVAVALLVSTSMISAFAMDTWPYSGDQALGKNEPSVHGYTAQDIAKWTPESDLFADMLRSFVPLQTRIDPFTATQANPNLKSDANWLACDADYGNAFLDNPVYTNKFAQYHFQFWQYIDYYTYWHGSGAAYVPKEYYNPGIDWTQRWFEFGVLNIPNPAWTDACHKNGVLSLGGLFFSNTDRGYQTYKNLLIKDDEGNFPVAEGLIRMADYFGFDGYFFNQEEQSPDVAVADVPTYIEFLKVLQRAGLYTSWYDAVDSKSGGNSFAYRIYDNNIDFLFNNGEAVNSNFFINYGGGSTTANINNTINYLNGNAAFNASGKTHWDVMRYPFNFEDGGANGRFGTRNGKSFLPQFTNSADNGNLRASTGGFGASFVFTHLDDDIGEIGINGVKTGAGSKYPYAFRADNDYQWMVNVRQTAIWSGPYLDPKNAKTTTSGNILTDVAGQSANWPGVASFMSEKSVIKGSNFYTNFNTGHGLRSYVNGAVSNDTEWSNIAIQDLQPTWQWWQDTTGSRLTVDFDYGTGYKLDGNRYKYTQVGGYNGGSSLAINGKLDAENFLHLYKTELGFNAGSKLDIVFNKVKNTDNSTLNVGVLFKDDPTTVVKVPVSIDAAAMNTWTKATLDLSAYAGRTVAAFGLVMAPTGEAIADYQINIGQMRIYDNSVEALAAPANLRVQYTYANSNEMTIKWDMDSDYSKVKQYNVYVNDAYIGGIYNNVYYIKKLPAVSGVVKVVAVSADGTEGAAATVDFDLTKSVKEIAFNSKEDGTTTVSWTNQGDLGAIEVNLYHSVGSYVDGTIATKTVAADATGVTFENTPINGDDYLLSIKPANGQEVSLSGQFVDKVCDPYAGTFSWAGNTVNLTLPYTRDWRFMYIYENGVPKDFVTTYTQNGKPATAIVRGRTSMKSTLTCVKDVTYAFSSTAKYITTVIEDYAGNKSEPVVLRDALISSAEFPDPNLLAWVQANVGTTFSAVANFAGTIDLAGVGVKNYTGLNLFAKATKLVLDDSDLVEIKDDTRFPANIKELDLSACTELLYIRDAAFKSLAKLETLNISGCAKLKLLEIKGNAIQNLITGAPGQHPDLGYIDITNTAIDVTPGSTVRKWADYVHVKQVSASKNLDFSYDALLSKGKSVNTNFSSPQNLVDGTTTGTLSSVSVKPAYVIVDLGQKCSIKSVAVYPYGSINYTPKDFDFSVSNDGTNFTPIGDAVVGRAAATAYTQTFAQPQTARYFKLNITNFTSTSVYLYELSVNGTVLLPYPSSVKYDGMNYTNIDALLAEANGKDENLYSIQSYAALMSTVESVKADLSSGFTTPAGLINLEATLRAAIDALDVRITAFKVAGNSSVSVKKGKTIDVKLTWEPAAVETVEMAFASSNPSVAQVSNQGIVLAVKPGMAVITVRALDGSGKTAQVLVTVTQ